MKHQPGVGSSPEITHSMGHYLMAIRDQLRELGYARVTDIANRLDISRSSASVAMASLRDKGYLTEDKNHFYRLTEEGERLATHIYGNHLLLESFFMKVLGISQETSLRDSCQIEHLLSRETSQKMLCFVQYLLDHEDELNTLLDRIRNYRTECSQQGACHLCMGESECPFHDLEEEAT